MSSVVGARKLRRRRGPLTEVFWQERNRDDVEGEGEDFADDHEHVPRRDLDRDHDELVEDERRERDRNNVEEL